MKIIKIKSSQEIIDIVFFYLLLGLLFLLPLIYAGATDDPFGVIKITLLRIVGSLVLLLIVWEVLATGRLRLPSGVIFYLLLAYLMLMTLATLFSISPAVAFLGRRTWYRGLWTYLILGILAFRVWLINWDRNKLRLLFIINIISGSLVGIIAVIQYLGIKFPFDYTSSFGWKAYSTFGNPNYAGMYMDMVLALAIWLFLDMKGDSRRYFIIIPITFIGAGIMATGSSGTLFTAINILLLSTILYFKDILVQKHLYIITLLSILLIIISLGFLFYSSGVEAASISYRTMAWRGAVKVSIAHPLLGTGPDTARFSVTPVLPVKTGFLEVPADAHNLFLTVALTSGIPALLVFVAICVFFFRDAFISDDHVFLANGLITSFAAYLMAAQLNPEVPTVLVLAWVIIAVVGYLKDGFKSYKLSQAVFIPMALVLTIFAVYSIGISINFLRAEYYLAQTKSASTFTQFVNEFNLAKEYNRYYSEYAIAEVPGLQKYILSGNRRAIDIGIAAGSEAIRRQPLEPDNYALLGTVYQALANSSRQKRYFYRAIDLYNQAIRYNPRSVVAANGLVQTYLYLNNQREALRWIKYYQNLTGRNDYRAIESRILGKK